MAINKVRKLLLDAMTHVILLFSELPVDCSSLLDEQLRFARGSGDYPLITKHRNTFHFPPPP